MKSHFGIQQEASMKEVKNVDNGFKVFLMEIRQNEHERETDVKHARTPADLVLNTSDFHDILKHTPGWLTCVIDMKLK